MFYTKTYFVFINKLLCFISPQAHPRIHARAQLEQMALATGKKVGGIAQFPIKIITVFGVFPRNVICRPLSLCVWARRICRAVTLTGKPARHRKAQHSHRAAILKRSTKQDWQTTATQSHQTRSSAAKTGPSMQQRELPRTVFWMQA